MKRRKFHQLTFALAGAYNLAWGAYSALDPQWLFRYAGMPLSNTPEIFACLAMVVGIYGFLYWQVARDPERGAPIAAVGLLGKVLGPIGLAQLIWSGAWPLRSIVLCITNDFIWWIPFTLYLMDVRAAASASARSAPAARA
ncbi:MAG TPA: hypothetical protein VEO54_27970 [Thermoanaerobaculia bacterium]|nr:hypothetical protein [Thermoanaerobaculia bacterium]